jgi:hypothetical protein
MSAEELFRRFQDGEIGMPELFEAAKDLPQAESSKLIELMLQHGFPEGEPDDGP